MFLLLMLTYVGTVTLHTAGVSRTTFFRVAAKLSSSILSAMPRANLHIIAYHAQDERQEFTIERLQTLYDELRRELRPPRKRPSSLTVVDSVAHDGDGSKPHW